MPAQLLKLLAAAVAFRYIRRLTNYSHTKTLLKVPTDGIEETVAKRSPLTSATGILALLDHDNNTIREEALKLLYPIVDVFWAEIAQKVDVIEALSEEESLETARLPLQLRRSAFITWKTTTML